MKITINNMFAFIYKTYKQRLVYFFTQKSTAF